jgi:DNA-binding IclR family transcriptional regulator
MSGSNPLRRAVRVVDAVAASRGGIALIDISHALKLPLSTTHRIVNSLVDVGYLSSDAATKTYRVGDRLKRLFLLTMGSASLRQLARPVLVELAEGFTETSYVVRLTTSGIELVDYYLPTRGSRTLVHPGFEFPMHASAAGKVIFAYQPDRVVAAEISKGLERYMPNTITDPAKVRVELKRVRMRGYAINDAELDAGVLALAAPLSINEYGVAAALALAGLKERILEKYQIPAIAKVICKHAKELSGFLVRDATSRLQKMA